MNKRDEEEAYILRELVFLGRVLLIIFGLAFIGRVVADFLLG